MKKRTRGNPIPLIVEEHPEDYDGYPFITLLKYRKEHVLALIDNTDEKHIQFFALDLCGPEQVNEERLIDVASHWWEERHQRYPISFEFSRLGMTAETSRIYRQFNVEFVTRVIGPLPRFEMMEVHSIKRRKRKPVPAGVEVKYKVLPLRPTK